MSKLQRDKQIASERGEAVPSLVDEMIYTHDDGSEWPGRYEARFTFTPRGDGPFGDGERFAVKPEQVRLAP